MLLRISLFVLLALGLVGFGVVAWLDMHPSRPQQDATQKITLLGTDHSLAPGTLIQPADFIAVSRLATGAPPGAVHDTPANRASYTGAMVRQRLATGAPLTSDAVIRPGDHGFLAAVLQPGMRAVSVGVDAITGTAGLIWPGDHVDLVLTQRLSAPNLSPARSVAAETVLTDVRVIAIDQRLVQGASGKAAVAAMARTVTLEVTPDQAERVAVAAHLGPLSLIVRPSEAAHHPARPPAPVYGGEVSPALAALSVPTGTGGVTVFEGPAGKAAYPVR